MTWLALAQTLVWGLTGYALLGVGFALLFVVWGVARVDDAAQEAGWGFRLLILPGAAALWPWLAWRWWRGGEPPSERTAHRTPPPDSSEQPHAFSDR
jgi:hypothetical protein